MGFPTILSTLQPFQICIFNRKQSKLTSSNGPQLMGKKCYGKFACIIGPYMEKQNFQNFQQMSDPRGVHSTTFHLELRNERFILISFMGFPTILSTLQPFQICIFNRKQSKLTSSNGPQLMGKKCYGKFACIIVLYMEKQNFQNFHQMSDPGGSIQQLFILNSEMHSKNFPILGGPFHNFSS